MVLHQHKAILQHPLCTARCFLANRALGKLRVKRRNNLVWKRSFRFFYFKTLKKALWRRPRLESFAVPSATHTAEFLHYADIPSTYTHLAVFTFPISLIANLLDGSQLHSNSGLNKPVFNIFRVTERCWQFPWEENNRQAHESPFILSTPVLLDVHSQHVSIII